MAGRRILIVNADDFGRSAGTNRGVARAHDRGIVTSASLMVRWPAAEEAATYSRGRPGLSLGLHVDLGEWAYRDGAWEAVYEVVGTTDIEAVRAEVTRQLDAFQRLVGSAPTHLDSHQRVHRFEPVRSVLRELANELGVPLRGESDAVRHVGGYYAQTEKGEPVPGGVGVGRLLEIVSALQPGVTELSCHPGEGLDPADSYAAERPREVEALCDARVRDELAARGVELWSFADLRR
jgi:predicted glycoside hydrolase/deacetylase ChbG (UPF0249 family)